MYSNNRQVKIGAIVGLSAIVLGLGFHMFQLASKMQLWGHWTLFFVLAFWGLMLVLFSKRYDRRWLALSTLSGVFLTLGFAEIGKVVGILFGLLAAGLVYAVVKERQKAGIAALITLFAALSGVVGNAWSGILFLSVAFVPLLWVENELNLGKNADTRQAGIFKYAFNTFVVYNLGATWWVGNAGIAAGMIANFLNAFFMAIPFFFFHKTAKTLRGTAFTFLGYLPLLVYWTGFEFMHLNWELSWPWLTLGNALADKTTFVQWYEYTGVLGGTLWVLLLNTLIFKFLRDAKAQRPWKTSATYAALVFGVPAFVFSLLIDNQRRGELGKAPQTAQVVAVQPNYEPHYEKFDIPESVQAQKYLRLASEKVDSTTDYLVFPETSFNFHNVALWNERPTVQTLRRFVRIYPQLHLVTGIDALRIYAQFTREKPDNLPKTARTYDNHDGTFTYWESYNAATQMTEGVDSMPLYKKSKLVPGPEILPYGWVFGWLKPLFDKFGGTVGGLGTQEERGVFRHKNGKMAVAPVICYESIYGDYCAGYVRNGASALFVVTNDGWWDDTPGYRQHLALARLRAIELRRSVVRSANTGSSCFIDPLGQVTQATAYGVDAAIKSTIDMRQDLTFYARYGDYLGLSAAILAVVWLTWWGTTTALRFGKR